MGTGCDCIPDALSRYTIDDAILLFERFECDDEIVDTLREQGVHIHWLPIRDFSIEPLGNVLTAARLLGELIEQGRGVLVSCRGGCGRTGTVIILYNIVYNCAEFNDALREYYSARGCGPETHDQHALLYKAWQIAQATGCTGVVCSQRSYDPRRVFEEVYEYARQAGLA